MLKHLPRIHIEPAPFGSQPIRSEMDGKAARFELERRACQSLRKVLQLKLQQRRTREELVGQGIIPPLKSSASFYEQKRSLERARTEDYLKRRIQRRPERAELIRMHILEEGTAEDFGLQKRARLADDLNEKLSQRPGPMELIHKNILPVHGSIKTAFIVPEFSKASDELSSAEEDSVDSVDSPLPCGTLTLTVAPCRLQDRSVSPLKPPAPVSTSAHGTTPENKQKINSEHCVQKHKKTKDDKPKMKKLKYHEYVPPDHKGEKEAPPKLDSSYAKLLQQQQLFLHLQILSQQQRQQSSTHTQPHPPTDQEQLKSTPVLPDAPLATSVKAEEKSASLPPNLEELKVAELKAELKLRGLPVSGTKSDLIERLRGAHAAGSGARAQPAGGGREPGAEGAAKAAKTTVNGQLALAAKPKCSTLQIKNSGHNCSKSTSLTSPENSTFITEPKEFKTEMPDHEPALTPQINISIKEEQLSPIPTSAPVEKTPKTPTSPAASLDKDSMLRQKDRQIEELKRLLLHNQRLVDVLKMKLEMRRRSEEQKTEMILHLRVAPPDKNGELHVKIKQEDADDDNTGTLGQLDPKLTNGEQNGRHQQAVHRLLLQQQSKLHSRPQAVQTHNQRDENRHKQEKVCQERKKKAPRQQQRVELDSQQILVKQERKDQQNIQIQTKTELEKPKQETAQVCPDQQLHHLLPFDLKNNATPAIVTDGNGNHFLIALTNQITDSHAHGNTSKHVTPQRFQWSPCKVPGHGAAPLPRPDNDTRAIMHTGGPTQPSAKAQSAGLNRATAQHQLRERPCEETESSHTNGDSATALNKICSGLDFLFSPVSPTASCDSKATEAEDFIDVILKKGDISKFKPSPDPALDHLHRSSSFSPLVPLPSLAAAPCLDPAYTAPSASRTSPGAAEQRKTGRLEDFLESTTGKPLLGVEPDGPLTLIDDLHSQMLCTASILDRPPSPMDTLDMEAGTCLEGRGVDGMDWLNLTVEENNKDLPELASPTPPSVFSTDFLDTYDLETAWDSCL